MSNKSWIPVAVLILLAAGCVKGELFNSQEHGFSFDYADNLVPDLSNIYGQFNFQGPEDTSIRVASVRVSKSLSSIDDIATKNENDYKKGASDVKVLSDNNVTISGKDAIEKVYLNTYQTPKGPISMELREIYVDNGDRLIIISCSSPDYNYDRANKIYFSPLIDSFKILPINDQQDKCIPGFPKFTSKAIMSSPLVADIDGDGSKEIVVGTNEGKLYAWHKDGTKVNGNFPYDAGSTIISSPAWGDIDGNGQNEIVFGSENDNIYVLKGDGSLLNGYPKTTEGNIRSSPVLGDLNGDGAMDVIVGSFDTGVYALGKDGSTICGFPVITGSIGVYSSPALGDLNGDNSLDIVTGTTRTDKELTNVLGRTVSEGRIFAVNSDGKLLDGFPVGIGINTDTLYSTPVLADINGDGSLEIIVGATDGLHVLNSKGQTLLGFPVKTDGDLESSSMAVGDIDNDKRLEIFAGGLDGRLYVWRNDGSSYPGFPMQTGGFVRYIILGDIDNDGKQEIIGASTDNRVHAWKLDGSEVAGFPKVTMGDIMGAPTLADIHGDKSLELVVGSNDGGLYVWKISTSYGDLDWPMIGQNQQHTGVFKPKQ